MKILKLEIIEAEWFIPFLCFSVLLFVWAISLGNVAKPVTTPNVSLAFKPFSTIVNAQETLQVEIFLGDRDAENISAVDLKIIYDKTKVKLLEATPGGFYAEPLVIKWEDGRYSLAVNPREINVQTSFTHTAKPVVKLVFEPLVESEFNLSFAPESQVYIYKKGAFYPKAFSGYYKHSLDQ